jgi:hypothetical protein
MISSGRNELARLVTQFLSIVEVLPQSEGTHSKITNIRHCLALLIASTRVLRIEGKEMGEVFVPVLRAIENEYPNLPSLA